MHFSNCFCPSISLLSNELGQYFGPVLRNVFISSSVLLSSLISLTCVSVSVRHGNVVVLTAFFSLVLCRPCGTITAGAPNWPQGTGIALISDFRSRFQVSDSRFQSPDFRVQIPGFRFQVSDSSFQSPDSKFQIPAFRVQIPGFRFQVSGSRFQILGF